MTIQLHDKVIKETAKKIFEGHGLKQKGRSRLWYFSGDYFNVLIEFQPSSWDKGSYLNIGVDFDWYLKDYLAFEFGDRVSDFKKFEDEHKFQKEIERMCDLALEKMTQYKLIFTDKKTAADKLLKFYKNQLSDWDKFNLGVLFGLGGHTDKAIKYLKIVSGDNFKIDWEIERAKVARDYIKLIENGDLSTALDEVIDRTKKLKGVN